jgi:hypothetical protein
MVRNGVHVLPNDELERPADGAEHATWAQHSVARPWRAPYLTSWPLQALVRSLLAIWAPLRLTRYPVMVSVHVHGRTVGEKVLRLSTGSHLSAVSASITAKWRLRSVRSIGARGVLVLLQRQYRRCRMSHVVMKSGVEAPYRNENDRREQQVGQVLHRVVSLIAAI